VAVQGRPNALPTLFECDQIEWLLKLKRIILSEEAIAIDEARRDEPPKAGQIGYLEQPRWLQSVFPHPPSPTCTLTCSSRVLHWDQVCLSVSL
jgi:hypothetical protein